MKIHVLSSEDMYKDIVIQQIRKLNEEVCNDFGEADVAIVIIGQGAFSSTMQQLADISLQSKKIPVVVFMEDPRERKLLASLTLGCANQKIRDALDVVISHRY